MYPYLKEFNELISKIEYKSNFSFVLNAIPYGIMRDEFTLELKIIVKDENSVSTHIFNAQPSEIRNNFKDWVLQSIMKVEEFFVYSNFTFEGNFTDFEYTHLFGVDINE